MNNTPLEQLHYLSDLIDQENNRSFDALIASLASHIQGQQDDYDIAAETRKEKITDLTLRALRIHAILGCLEAGQSADVEMLQSDWETVLDCVKYLEYAWKVTGELLCDAIELVLLYDPTHRNSLIRNADIKKKQLAVRPSQEEDVFLIADAMLDYGMQNGFEAESMTLLENLIKLSEARRSRSIQNHRHLVSVMLGYIIDYNRPLACKIVMEQAQYFNGCNDEVTAQFYWYGGYTLSMSEKPDEAEPFFKRCIPLYCSLEGERSWSAARANLFYHLNRIDTEWTAASEQFLRAFLKNCENGYYTGLDGSASYLEAYARYILLSRCMKYGSLRGLLPEIERFLSYCAGNEKKDNNQYLTVRVAENFFCGYYLEVGDNLLAAQHGEKALSAPPIEGLPQYPPDEVIRSNLLNVYSQLNDADKMDKLIEQLASDTEMISNPETSFHGTREEFYRMSVVLLSASSKLGVPESEHLNDFKEALSTFYSEMSYHTSRWREAGETDVGYGLYLLTCISGVLDSFSSDRKELTQYLQIVEHLLKNRDVYAFRDVQNAVAYMMKADVLWQLEDPRAVQAAQQCLRYSNAFDPSQETYISAQRLCAVIFYNSGRPDLARTAALDTLHSITASWHKAVAYLNDHRVCQVFSNIQFYYDICYSILKQESSVAERYRQVLLFKNLPALVGRERNRILRSAPTDEKLIRKIYRLQDQIAAAQIDDAINGTNHCEDILAELQTLEAEFAAAFPQNARFTEISIERIAERLSDHEAILEYYFSYGKKALNGKPCTSEYLELEVFVLCRDSGETKLHYYNAPNGSQILEAAESLIECYQKPALWEKRNATELKANLYRWLIAPIRSYIRNTTKLYLAPDLFLCNLPIENLFADGAELFYKEHNICRIVCGRDLLFYQDSSYAGGSLVLGDPAYDYDRDREPDSERRTETGDEAEPLPFSKLEAYTVGRLCGCRPLTGTLATKYALQENLPCRIIHLATHGTADKEMESDALYSSALLFAGYNDWITTGIEKSRAGNGILTADEISRMDLSRTELVVLSACDSGLGDTMFGSTQGLISAFSAAGAKWVICHLWSANDCAAAILMGIFYHNYLVRHLSVPDALRDAKSFLQNASIQQLQQQGWLDVPKGVHLAPEVLESIEELKHSHPRKKEFNSEFLWGGFVCYQCK